MKTFDLTATDLSTASLVRELDCDELEHISGAVTTSSNLYSTSYQGGADGYGGSRRNP
jgi:hypothetical protein